MEANTAAFSDGSFLYEYALHHRRIADVQYYGRWRLARLLRHQRRSRALIQEIVQCIIDCASDCYGWTEHKTTPQEARRRVL